MFVFEILFILYVPYVLVVVFMYVCTIDVFVYDSMNVPVMYIRDLFSSVISGVLCRIISV